MVIIISKNAQPYCPWLEIKGYSVNNAKLFREWWVYGYEYSFRGYEWVEIFGEREYQEKCIND